MLSGEPRHSDPARADILSMYDTGIPAFMRAQISPEEATFRVRRAYDTAWQHVHEIAFGPTDSPFEPSDDPAQDLLAAFSRIWQQKDDEMGRPYVEFASLGNWSRKESNEIEVLFKDDAQYFYETAFGQKLTELCVQGNLTGDGEYPDPTYTADLLRNYMSTVFLTWMAMPDGNSDMRISDAQLGVYQILFGRAPSPDS